MDQALRQVLTAMSRSFLHDVRHASHAFLKRQPRLLRLARKVTLPAFRSVPLDLIPGWLGELHQICVPRSVVPNPERSPVGPANIKILLRLVDETRRIEGSIAECGVFRGGTLLAMGLYVKRHGIQKEIWGFDSFAGFDDSIQFDLSFGGTAAQGKEVGGFGNTSFEEVSEKVSQLGLSMIRLEKGFFRTSLPRSGDRQFCLVHLDCDIYQSYRECLEFFYPRLSRGGIVLLDEYNDPPWPGCNKAVDEFLADKPEKPIEIESDNRQKWYLRKN